MKISATNIFYATQRVLKEFNANRDAESAPHRTWMQLGEKAAAAKVAGAHGSGGCGDAKRRLPIGGRANGMPCVWLCACVNEWR